MNLDVSRRIEEIRHDHQHGAGWLSREAISVMGLMAKRSEANSTSCFRRDLEMIALMLEESRPSMAPIRNIVSRWMSQVSKKTECEENLQLLRDFALSLTNQLLRESVEAMTKVVQIASRVISDADTVMTCSYSSTVCQVFQAVRDRGKSLSVITAASLGMSGEVYGERTVKELEALNIPVALVEDNAIAHHLPKANMVIVGADTILRDGSVINGTPSLQVALAAKMAGIPFYSVGESFKVSCSKTEVMEPRLEPDFDKVPPNLITGIATEAGIMTPQEVFERVCHQRWESIQ